MDFHLEKSSASIVVLFQKWFLHAGFVRRISGFRPLERYWKHEHLQEDVVLGHLGDIEGMNGTCPTWAILKVWMGHVPRGRYWRYEWDMSHLGDIKGMNGHVQEDDLPVTVRVLNVNDNNPEFSLPEYEFTAYNRRLSTVGRLQVSISVLLNLPLPFLFFFS